MKGLRDVHESPSFQKLTSALVSAYLKEHKKASVPNKIKKDLVVSMKFEVATDL
jgi:hypothetical protein